LFFAGIIVYGIVINLREISLKEALAEKNITQIENPSIVIDRRNYALELYLNKVMVKKYNVVFGRNSGSKKYSKDDFITPSGEYKICKIDTNHTYYKKLYLNYPNTADAAEALRLKLISQDQFEEIIESNKKNICPYPKSPLGADIGIQGIGEYNFVFKNLPFVFNWTNGSIALSNENTDEILSVVKIGTRVTIKN
jgi:murein L,D-transpeptidase YafK